RSDGARGVGHPDVRHLTRVARATPQPGPDPPPPRHPTRLHRTPTPADPRGTTMGAFHADDPHHPHRHAQPGAPLRVGIGGPVGSGKTELVAALCRAFAGEMSVAVVTNDVFTTEDAKILERMAVLPTERIVGVETGC